MTFLLHIIVVSKVFELQRSDTTQLIDFLKLFKMLTDFFIVSPPMNEPRVVKKLCNSYFWHGYLNYPEAGLYDNIFYISGHQWSHFLAFPFLFPTLFFNFNSSFKQRHEKKRKHNFLRTLGSFIGGETIKNQWAF